MRSLLTRAPRTSGRPPHRLRDPLTGLATRALLVDRVRRATANQDRYGGIIALLFIDIDEFAMLNNSRGPTIGDQLLIAVAERLGRCMRSTDTLARTAGDEFGILLDDLTDEQGSLDAAQRVVDALAEPLSLPGESMTITASVGVTLSAGRLPADELIRQAGLALERAQSCTDEPFVLYDAELYGFAMDHVALKYELVEALASSALTVQYQPIVELASGSVIAVEALVRWEVRPGTWRSPDTFIPIAERSKLVSQIDELVLRQACAEHGHRRRLHGDRAPTLSVNLSAQSLRQRALPELIATILDEHRLSGRDLTVEVSERTLITDNRLVGNNLRALKELGVAIALDDFGTGQSSLTHLDTFPVDQLKIDRSFILGIPGRGHRLAKAVLSLGDALGLAVVAEGIERPEQLETLRDLGCNLGQGYLLGRPADSTHLDVPRSGAQPTHRERR